MKLDYLWIQSFKNLQNIEINFDEDHLMTVILGWNGSGKSNIMEALVSIFRNLDLGIPPQLTFSIQYRIKNYKIRINANCEERIPSKAYEISIHDSDEASLLETYRPLSFTSLKRDENGNSEYLPKYIFAYYSGTSNRLQEYFRRHQSNFYEALLKNTDETNQPLRPLFYALPIHSQFVLLAFFISEDEKIRDFLKDNLGIVGLESVLFIMRQPSWKSREGDPRFWNSRGTVKTFLGRIYNSCTGPVRFKKTVDIEMKRRQTKEYLHLYIPDVETLKEASHGLTPTNFFKMLESTYISDVLDEVRIRVKLETDSRHLTFSELSEGEQQLLTVLGLLKFTAEEESLFLLDEPDTHLNPAWATKYLSFLRIFLEASQIDTSHIIMTSHNPLTISELEKGQVQIVWYDRKTGNFNASSPKEDPRGMGVSNILLSDMFGLSTTLDRITQDKIRTRSRLSGIEDLSDQQQTDLKDAIDYLESRSFNNDQKDPIYREYLIARQNLLNQLLDTDETLTPEEIYEKEEMALKLIKSIAST